MAQPPARLRHDQHEEREVQSSPLSNIPKIKMDCYLSWPVWLIQLCPKNNNKACFGSWSRSSVVKGSAWNASDPGSIPRLGRSPGEGSGYPLQYSCLENPMDRGAWQATVHGVARVGHNLATKLQTITSHVIFQQIVLTLFLY